MSHATRVNLSLAQRAAYLEELAALLHATGDPALAMKKLAEVHADQRSGLRAALAVVERGGTLPDALLRTGWANAAELKPLEALLTVGSAPDSVRRLARQLGRADTAQRALRVRLWASWALLVVVVIVASLMLALKGESPLGLGWTLTVVTEMLILAAIAGSMLWLVTVSAWQWLGVAWELGLHQQRAVISLFEATWLLSLVRLWAAGLDIAAALSALRRVVPGKRYQQTVDRAIGAAGRGDGLADLLRDAGIPLSSEVRQLLAVGEQSGALDEALKRQLAQREAWLHDVQQSAVTWLPRLFYLAVLLSAARLLTAL